MDVTKAQVVEILRSRGDDELADRANRELPTAVDPATVDFLRDIDLGIDAGDAARHAGDGQSEDMAGLPKTGPDSD
jgi:hypothetical protein